MTALKTTGTQNYIFNGKYTDFTPEWFGVVGITIFTTAFINGFTPMSNLYQWCMGNC